VASMFHFRKSYWAPDGQGGYKESTLVDGDIEKEGAKCTVMIGHEVIMIPGHVIFWWSYDVVQHR